MVLFLVMQSDQLRPTYLPNGKLRCLLSKLLITSLSTHGPEKV